MASVQYDAAIIGAGADGLGAAGHLARAGLKVVVIERGRCAGGRVSNREFHFGFRAAPFMDSLPEIPAPLLDTLDIGVRAAGETPDAVRRRHDAALTRAFTDAATP